MFKLSETQDPAPIIEAILTKCKTLNHLKQLQSTLFTLGHSQVPYFSFKLIRFCTLHLSNLTYAHSIFNHLKSPNVYLYSAMINAYASKHDHYRVVGLYKDMLYRGRPRPNHFVYPHVLKSSSFDSFGTKMVHAQIVKTGFGSNPVVETALVDSYSRFGCGVGVARQLFDEMSERNVVSWTAMVSGYCRVGEVGNAVLLFEEMHVSVRDVPSWNSIISGCAQNGLFLEAVSFLRKMVGVGESVVGPNAVTLACVLSACCQMGTLHLGKEIHGYVYRRGLGRDSFISNSLVDLYGKCGCLKEARRVFDATLDRSLASWNSMINCYALHGESDSALGVFEEVLQGGEDVIPDEITFIGLLTACTHGGLVEKGYHYFDLMTRVYGIEPQIEHYGCIIDLLGRAGRFEEVMDIIDGMKVEPDEVIWGSLLNACKVHGNANLAEFALKKLTEIHPNNGQYMSMLANLYVGLANWDEVRGVRKMLKDQNSQKIPGCSWIEVDCRTHQFYSADHTHPRAEEIYNVLESLFDFINQGLLGHSCDGSTDFA